MKKKSFLQLIEVLRFYAHLKLMQTQSILSSLTAQRTVPLYFSLLIFVYLFNDGPPLWSSGQSSWLQIRRPGLDSRHYQKKK
jgi:hypothetical protein